MATAVGPGVADRSQRRAGRDARAGGPGRRAGGGLAARAPEVRHGRSRPGRRLHVDRRCRHRQRALHPLRPRAGRRAARPHRTRVARLHREGRRADPRRCDVHRQRTPDRRSVAHRLGGRPDAVAQPRRPLLGPRERREQGRRTAAGRRHVCTGCQLRRRQPDGARVDHAARVRRVRGARRGRRRPDRRCPRRSGSTSARPATTTARPRRSNPSRTTRPSRSTSAAPPASPPSSRRPRRT